MRRQEFADQLQNVRLFGRFARILDDDLHRPAVRKQPHAVAVALGEPDQIEQAVGLMRIELAQAERYSGS